MLRDSLRPDEITKLLDGLSQTKCGKRDVALAIFLLNTGMRITECLLLKFGDVWNYKKNRPLEEIFIRRETTKRKKERYMPLNTHAREAIRTAASLSHDEAIPPECPVWQSPVKDEAGNIIAIKKRTFQNSMQSARTRAGLPYHITSHCFRHTFITSIVQATHDIQMAADLAGHKHLETTLKYTHRSRDEKALAVQALDIVPSDMVITATTEDGKIIKITPELIKLLEEKKAI
jgi:integrase/recombinase XerD